MRVERREFSERGRQQVGWESAMGVSRERVGDWCEKGKWGGESRKAIRDFQSAPSSAASSPST